MRYKMNRKLLLISFIAFFSFETHAHQISRSFSKWEIEENIAKAVFTVPARQVTLLPVLEGYSSSLQDQLTTHLKNYLKISISGQSCQILKGPETQLIDNGYVQSKIEFTCSENGEKLSIYNGTFFPVSAGHIHFARILLDNNDWQERECGALWKQKGRNQNFLSGHVEVDNGLGEKQKVQTQQMK